VLPVASFYFLFQVVCKSLVGMGSCYPRD